MKCCRTLLYFILFACVLCIYLAAQQAPTESAPANGRVDGNVYRNAYFGFNYFIPDQWIARGAATKLPGQTNGFLLLPLKRKAGDALSSITVSAIDLSKYGGNLPQFLDERHRLRRETGNDSETTINGIHVSRGKAKEQELELLMIGDRTFYRLTEESTGVTRMTVATAEKGYALMFELIAPTRSADEMTTPFMDSLHSLDFSPARNAVRK